MFSESPCGLADSEIRTPIAPDFKSVAATSGRRRVYQNKLLPYKAEQFLLAGFDTPSSYKFLLNAQIHAARSISGNLM